VIVDFLAEKPLPCHDLGRGKAGIISIVPFPYWVDCNWKMFSFAYPHSWAPLGTSLQLITIITYCKSYTFTSAPATNHLSAHKSCMTQLTPKVTKQKCWLVNFDYDSVHVKCQDIFRKSSVVLLKWYKTWKIADHINRWLKFAFCIMEFMSSVKNSTPLVLIYCFVCWNFTTKGVMQLSSIGLCLVLYLLSHAYIFSSDYRKDITKSQIQNH
jgi:hypothetical protein